MEKPVNLLWTSGWDSTFRLLDLLLVQHRVVQPYYIKDHLRKSLHMEMKTMEKLKQMIFNKAPDTQQLLLPTIFVDLQNIRPCEQLQQQYKRLKSTRHLGAQYEWLACFAEQEKIYDLELCVNRETQRAGCFTQLIYPTLVKEVDGNSFNYRAIGNPDHPDLLLFKYFRFPIHQLSKLDTQELAIKNGFIDIMNHTWFCHSPINGQPCGVCNPCCMTIEEGLRKRIPLRGQIRHFIHTHVRLPVKQLIHSDNESKRMNVP